MFSLSSITSLDLITELPASWQVSDPVQAELLDNFAVFGWSFFVMSLAIYWISASSGNSWLLTHYRAQLRQHSARHIEEDVCLKLPELTIWNDREHEDESKGFSVNPEAEKFHGDSGDILFYAVQSGGSED